MQIYFYLYHPDQVYKTLQEGRLERHTPESRSRTHGLILTAMLLKPTEPHAFPRHVYVLRINFNYMHIA